MPVLEVDNGITMAYQDRGSGRPIVFVHGWGGSGDVWDYQVMDLADRYRVITVDLRGHGASDKSWGSYDYEVFCADLRALMTALELEDVTLVGWSMGGHIGLKYAIEGMPAVTRLVITGSGPRFLKSEEHPYGGEPESAAALIDAIIEAKPETVAGLYGNNFHRTDLEATREWFIRIGEQVPGFIGLSSFRALLDEDLTEGLSRISIPVAVFSGAHDQIWDPGWSQVAATLIPDSTLVSFDNSGHVAFVEDRHAWNDALETFITEHS